MVNLNAYNNSAGTGTPNVYNHILRFTAPAGGWTAGTWVPSDLVTTFVPNVSGTYCRLLFLAMYTSTGAVLTGQSWGLDDILFQAQA